MRNNLIIVRAGDDSRHPEWLGQGADRNFDLFVSYYGSTPDRYRAEAEYYHVLQGPRWPAHQAICAGIRDRLRSYEHVAFVCDDLEAPVATWNRLFEVCRANQLHLAQPAIEGHTSFPITKPEPGCLLRFTNFVETMSPVFHRSALERVYWTLGESVSGWGLDLLWSQALPWPQYRLAIIDAVRVHHARPVKQGPLYSVLQKRGINPRQEMVQLMARHGLNTFILREHARLPLPA